MGTASYLALAWLSLVVQPPVAVLASVVALGLAMRMMRAAAGAVGAYPIFTVTLCALVFATAGAVAVQRVLFGMVRGLPAYLTFVLVYARAATSLGAGVGVIVATLACSTCYVLPVLRFQGLRPALGA